MSCAGMDDHYVLLCDRNDCRPLFRASDRHAYGTCGRAMAISTFPDWAKQPIIEVIRSSTSPTDRPLVTAVAFQQRYSRVPSNAQQLREGIQRGLEPRVSQHAEGPELVRAWYDRRCAADARSIRWRVVQHILLGLSLLIALIGTSVWFLVRLLRQDGSARRSLLFHVLAIRLGLFVLGVGFLFALVFVPPVLLLAPLALLFAVLDLAMFGLIGWVKKAR